MSAIYELWDTVTANIIGTFHTEHDVLLFVRGVIKDGQRVLVEGWALGWEDDDGDGGQIAAGIDLVNRALCAGAESSTM